MLAQSLNPEIADNLKPPMTVGAPVRPAGPEHQRNPSSWHENFWEKGGMRVLIADDEKSVGASLADLVTHCNHEVVEVVESGFDAIQAYTRHRPDVVLMDYWMSKLNGATACRNILAKDPAARIILVSGWSPTTDLSESGAIAILSKPITIEMLAEALKAAVQSSPLLVEWVAALS